MGYVNVEEHVLLFDITGDELRKHCETRTLHHKERQEFFQAQEKNFEHEVEEFGKSLPAGGFMSGGVMSGTLESNKQRMANQKREHETLKRYFRFCTAHLLQEKYQLTEDQAKRLEMIA